MTTPASPSPGVYHSRSRVTRNRLVLAAAGLALVLLGYLIGRLQGGSATPAPAAAAVAAPSVASSSSPADPPASPSPSPATPAPGGIDAYSVIQAEAAAGQQGTQFQETEDEGGGQNVAYIGNGDWLRFDDVDFGDEPATKFAARVASEVDGGGRLEVRLDSPGNTPAATLEIADTGGWQDWESRTTDVEPVTGRHTVFITFGRDGGEDFVNVNYFAFAH
ncbi:arabinoxylan arabinofuranohydrolase [Actinoplanes sp. ATCC 53533]|uniref:carbohydrate-binding protein n=1 Tax=Actinoplanes sp. ATCC 53533 TaxID=1288362 RepID=UPI000F7B7921|nr:carbohydrate-binding protein [Actinoplanes sp. ATCC 53533]RSM48594.1 arabinoxylan arabinofuranohydrolase [Actinoplanes sp. ATCC 53533]